MKEEDGYVHDIHDENQQDIDCQSPLPIVINDNLQNPEDRAVKESQVKDDQNRQAIVTLHKVEACDEIVFDQETESDDLGRDKSNIFNENITISKDYHEGIDQLSARPPIKLITALDSNKIRSTKDTLQ